MKFSLVFYLQLILITGLFGQSNIEGNVASIVITPPLDMKYTLGGYGARMGKPAEGIHDDIRAKSLVLTKDARKYVIITMDIVGFPPNVRPMLADKLSDDGWTTDKILLLPSHSHTSLEMLALNDKNIFNNPAIGIFQPDLLDFVVDKLAEVVRLADQDLVGLRVGTDQIKLEGLNRNRRGDPTVDRELTVTRIDALDGTPKVVMVNWTAHPTIMSDEDMWVSCGWPGYLQRELEEWIGNDVVAMYYNGAEGDQSVITHQGTSHYERAEYYGRRIALDTHELYKNIQTSTAVDLDFASKQVALPARQAHPSFMKTGGTEYQLSEAQVQGLIDQLFPFQVSISALRLGELVIVGAPGEMIAEIGLDIKNQLRQEGVKFPVIGGLANEWISYILNEDEYRQGGYETSVSFYGPDLGEVIKEGMISTSKMIIK